MYDLFGLSFTSGSAAEILEKARLYPRTRPRLIVTTNTDHVITLSQDGDFRRAYSNAVARTLDGMPLVWLARLKGQRNARRVTGHDLLATALSEPWDPQMRIFLVCATDQVANAMADFLLSKNFPAAALAVSIPPFGFGLNEDYKKALAEKVKLHDTTLLVIGVGAPQSEVWVDQYGSILGGPVVLAVGDAVNVAAGFAPRAPIILQKVGLEWLFRFANAPRRLFYRYFIRSWKLFWLFFIKYKIAI